jgi:hypothetical protein
MRMTRLATLHRSFPTLMSLGALLRWVGRSRRRLWGTALLTLAVIASPPLWWATQLIGLPDVGDPFDVRAFQTFTMPGDRNAFVLYRQAASLLKQRKGNPAQSNLTVDLLAPWSQVVPDLRQWAEENREALAVYRQGTERPDALDPAIGFDSDGSKTFRSLWSLRLIALLEASRLEERGDMAGAWGWYRALLRTTHHIGMHSAVERRNMILRWHRDLRDRLMTWADDPRTSPALLRRALDDVVACEALSPSERDSLMAGYVEVSWLLDGLSNPGRNVPRARFQRFWNPDYQLNPEQMQMIWDTWRFWRREPERSRRVVRLVTANWMTYLGLPAGERPKPDPDVASLDLYSFGPQLQAQSRALSPEVLGRWFDTAHDAQQVLRFLDGSGVQTVEQANHADLLILLATELYHRDHGTDPPTPQALVGPYLKSLPAEFYDTEAQRERSMNELNWFQGRSSNDKRR